MSAAPFEVRDYEAPAAPGTDYSGNAGLAVTLTGVATRRDTEGAVALCTGGAAMPIGVIQFADAGPSARVKVVTAGSARCIVGAGVVLTPGVDTFVTLDAAGAVTPVLTFPPAADTFILGKIRFQDGAAKTAGQAVMVDINPAFLTA